MNIWLGEVLSPADANVQGHVDGISKRSHEVIVPRMSLPLNAKVDRAPGNAAFISKRTVGGFRPTFCSVAILYRGIWIQLGFHV